MRRGILTRRHIDMHAPMPINVPLSAPIAFFSFGGWKQSLFSDSPRHGVEGIYFNTRTKASRPLRRRKTR